MGIDKRAAARPKPEKMAKAGRARTIKEDTRRAAARKARRAKIKSLLNEWGDQPLAELWQRVCPLPICAEYELPDRRGMIEDLADFAEMLLPAVDGVKTDQLCRLIEKYAACAVRPADVPVSRAARQKRSRKCRTSASSGSGCKPDGQCMESRL